MDLNIPTLFDDLTWQRCLNRFIRHLTTLGYAGPALQDARKTLLLFFADPKRLPADYSAQDIEYFLRHTSNPKNGRPASLVTQRQWKAVLEAFYAFLKQDWNPAEAVPEPSRPREPIRQHKPREPREPKHELVVIEVDDLWRRCMMDYLRSMYERGKSMKTAALHAGQLRIFFSGSAGGGLPKHPAAYTRMDVEDFVHRPCLSGRHAGGEPAQSTKIVRLTILRSFYKYASNYTVPGEDGTPRRLLETLPPTLGIVQGKRGEPRPKAMTFEEVKRFFAAIDSVPPIQRARDRCIFMLYLITLRRRESIIRLTWGDISRVTITDEHGHSREIWQYSFTEKGRAGEVETLELPETCAQAVLDYLRISGRLDTIKPEDALFIPIGFGENGARTYRDAHKPLVSTTVAYNFKRYCAKAGLGIETFSIHSFRHTGIQQRLLAGEDMFDVMKISGHRSLDVFYRYARRLTGVTDPGASKMEKRFDFLGVK